MKRRLFIFIGGSDEQNGDYSWLLRRARRGGTANWACFKSSCPGDKVLIYIQRPISALVAKAEVLANAVKGGPGDYAYRAKTGRFELLPNRVSFQDLKREFPGWAWLRFPRGKAVVPDKYVEPLWSLVHEKQSSVQILISNAGYGKQLLQTMAASARTASWYVPKLTTAGDRVLFYVEEPLSAIVALGKALSSAKATSKKWWEAKVGQVRWLDRPITLVELRQMFPNWPWLRSVNMFAYVSPERARALMARCDPGQFGTPTGNEGATGGGFGDAEANAIVEAAAVREVIKHLKERGFAVRSRESERIGYDLDARKGRTELHVEVKGVSGAEMQFLITNAEVSKAASDPCSRLMVVTKAGTPAARVTSFRGLDLQRFFVMTPVSFRAERK